MHLPNHQGSTTTKITTIMERTSSEAPTLDAGVTKISVDLFNMTFDEIQRHFEMLENLTQPPEDLDIMKQKNWQIAVIAIYSIVILSGFLENFVIVCVLLKNSHLHTPTNIFIMGLATSDILLCSFNLPFQLHYQLTDVWIFGRTLCHVIMPTFGVPVFVSSMSILMIAIDRYMLIVHPFKRRMTKLTAICIFLSIAVCTTLLAVPIIIHTDYVVIDLPGLRIYRTYCIEKWKNIGIRHFYTVSTVFIQFFVPLIATSLLYIQISNVLKRRPVKKNEQRKNHKTNCILISIVLLFFTCWLPWNSFYILSEFNHKLVSGKYYKLIDLLLKIFAMSSACINPFLYGWLNDNFRRELDVIVKRPGRNRIRQNGHTYTLADYSRTDMMDKYSMANV